MDRGHSGVGHPAIVKALGGRDFGSRHILSEIFAACLGFLGFVHGLLLPFQTHAPSTSRRRQYSTSSTVSASMTGWHGSRAAQRLGTQESTRPNRAPPISAFGVSKRNPLGHPGLPPGRFTVGGSTPKPHAIVAWSQAPHRGAFRDSRNLQSQADPFDAHAVFLHWKLLCFCGGWAE